MSSPDATASDPTVHAPVNEPDLSSDTSDDTSDDAAGHGDGDIAAGAESAGEDEPLDLDAIERDLAEIEAFLEQGDDGDDEDQPMNVDPVDDEPDHAIDEAIDDAVDDPDVTAADGDADLT